MVLRSLCLLQTIYRLKMNDAYPFTSNSHWKVINIDNREFRILAKNESNTWKICLTNLIEIWCEELNTETILERCKALNPLLKLKVFNVDEIMEEILSDIPSYIVQNSINSITLNKNIQGGIFKFKIELSKGSEEQFFETVTKCLCLSSRVLLNRYYILLDVIKKKEEEIAEYKAEGAQLIRKNIETKPFTRDIFDIEDVDNGDDYLNAFQSVVDIYTEFKKANLKSQPKCYEDSKRLSEVKCEVNKLDKDVPESSEISITSLNSTKGLNSKKEDRSIQARKTKGAISASYSKPIKKPKRLVTNFIT